MKQIVCGVESHCGPHEPCLRASLPGICSIQKNEVNNQQLSSGICARLTAI
jgi:hypothetical protein